MQSLAIEVEIVAFSLAGIHVQLVVLIQRGIGWKLSKLRACAPFSH